MPFARVARIGRQLPGVQVERRYDGARVLRLRGCFVAGLASHRSAEPDTLVTRMTTDDRDLAIEDAPDCYYVTDFYRPYPLVLSRLSKLSDDVLKELLTISCRLTEGKGSRRRERPGGSRLA